MEFINLGQKLKQFRQRAKKTQMQLELEIQLSYGAISRIWTG